MRKSLLFVVLALLCQGVLAQNVSIEPVITPLLFRHNDQITVTYDVTGTSLASLSNAYIWVWIPGKNINAKYNVNPANTTIDPAKFTKSVSAGKTTFSLTFRPSDIFTASIAAETTLGMLLKGPEWSNGQTKDFLAPIWDGSFKILLKSPAQQPLFVNPNGLVLIQAETPVTADYDLFVNNVLVNEQNGVAAYSYQLGVTQSSGAADVKLVATSGSSSAEITFQYIISGQSPTAPRPAGTISGINYKPNDPTRVILCLLAPGKTSVYAFGDFSQWKVLPENIMKRDGEYFWIELTGLTSGVEYGFQYLVDQTLFIADPYADKILDPDDQFIPAAVYPNLKPFPQQRRSENWYFNRISVFQTGQTPYAWQVPNFQRPPKEKLVIYELLIRDFFGEQGRSYQNLIDTIGYIKRLGANAIHLMPIMEFNGNDSWGYNPTFMFAPDKYYGRKEKFKEFVDQCHKEGIAVILDIAMNHQDMPNPYLMLDFNYTTFAPLPTNRYFNVSATHPFNVFYDMNHESAYTKKYLDTVNFYWLNEYKVDGYRFDLSKGFTQTNNPDNVGAWSAYDASRIALLKRMADKIWQKFPTAYVILEHLSVNSEEKELAEYRSAEGKGMMLWGKMTEQYAQATKGFASNSDFSGVYHTARNWTVPHLIGYMESHDEERMMFQNMNFGASGAGGYTVRNQTISLNRIRAASTFFYTVPGPKMLWQFGELGYDFSINHCPNGTINPDCRVAAKPVRWEYYQNEDRRKLYDHIADLNKLRNAYDVFTSGQVTFEGNNELMKQLTLRNTPYVSNPTSNDEMNVVIVSNFGVAEATKQFNFPHTGTWYNYTDGNKKLNVPATAMSLTLKASEFRMYTDVPVGDVVTSLGEVSAKSLSVFPNPAASVIRIEANQETIRNVSFFSMEGKPMNVERVGDSQWSISHLSKGIYIIRVETATSAQSIKWFKN